MPKAIEFARKSPTAANRRHCSICFCSFLSCPCLDYEAESVPMNVRFVGIINPPPHPLFKDSPSIGSPSSLQLDSTGSAAIRSQRPSDLMPLPTGIHIVYVVISLILLLLYYVCSLLVTAGMNSASLHNLGTQKMVNMDIVSICSSSTLTKELRIQKSVDVDAMSFSSLAADNGLHCKA